MYIDAVLINDSVVKWISMALMGIHYISIIDTFNREGIKNKMKQFGAYRFFDIDFAIFYLYVKVKKKIA